MATIDNFILCPSVGQAWAKAVQLWMDWVTDNTKTISRGVGTALSCRTILMQYVQGADTYKYHLACAEIPSGAASIPLAYVLQCPGFRAMPTRMADVYGATTTKTSFESVIRGLRSNILETFCAHATVAWTTTSYTGVATGLDFHRYYTPLRIQAVTAMDALQLAVSGATYVITMLNDAQPTDGLVAGPQATTYKPVDIAALTQAVEDLGHVDLQTTIDNGAVTVIQGSGDVLATP